MQQVVAAREVLQVALLAVAVVEAEPGWWGWWPVPILHDMK